MYHQSLYIGMTILLIILLVLLLGGGGWGYSTYPAYRGGISIIGIILIILVVYLLLGGFHHVSL